MEIRKPMLAKPINPQVILKKWPKTILVQPKIDGHRATYQHGKLWSRGGKEIVSVPHILNALHEADAPEGLDGELWVRGCTHQQVSTYVRTQYAVQDHEKVGYHVFDIMSDLPCIERVENVQGHVEDICHTSDLVSCIHSVHTWATTAAAAKINNILKSYMDMGWEGIILRNPNAPYQHKRTSDLMKLKPMKDDVYLITGTQEECTQDGKPKGRLGALWCTTYNEGIGEAAFKVGTGLNHQQRQELWDIRESLLGKLVHVKYQYLTERGVPCHPVVLNIQEGGEGQSSS